jgi:hypothetical protein
VTLWAATKTRAATPAGVAPRSSSLRRDDSDECASKPLETPGVTASRCPSCGGMVAGHEPREQRVRMTEASVIIDTAGCGCRGAFTPSEQDWSWASAVLATSMTRSHVGPDGRGTRRDLGASRAGKAR